MTGSGLLLSLAALVAGPVSGDAESMVPVSDLRQEARILRDRNLVLVLEFASDSCEYCRKLEAQFLLPMQRNAEYDDQILIRSVPLDGYENLLDFEGRSITTSEFASRYDVSLTPTLVFLNADGEELTEKLVGIWSEDFYGSFIDDRIAAARTGL